MLLSIGMMVKNESKYLRKCLESLQSIRDVIDSELIIVDTGSTDNTVEIAKEFTDKVYYHKWENDFSKMRNTTISYSNGEWFMYIDGDEIINDPNGIIEFFKFNKHKEYNTACVSIKSFTSTENEKNFSVLLAPRLFKNYDSFCFKGAIHNQPKLKKPIIMLNSEWIHYGYINDDKELMERKFKRTATILKGELKKDPENIYYLFQLSVSYAMHGDIEESLEPICKAYNLIKVNKLHINDYLYVYGQLAKTYLRNNKYKEVEEICNEIIKEDNIYIDLYFYLARAQYMMNKNEQSIKNYSTYLDKVSNYSISQTSKNITIVNDTLGKYENAYLDLSVLYDRIGEFETSLEYLKKIDSDSILQAALNRIIILHGKLNVFEELKRYYDYELVKKHSGLEENFLSALEKYIVSVTPQTRKRVYQAFSDGDTKYSLLNKLRIELEHDYEGLEDKVKIFNFNNLPSYYGDLLYFSLCKKISLEDLLDKTNDFKIKEYFNLLMNKYDDLGLKIYAYIKEFGNKDLNISSARISKVLAIYLFKSNCISDSQYKEIFESYLKSGYYYLEQVYNENVIENELVNIIKEEEDLFLMYMYLAEKYKQDKSKYLRNIRMALSSCKYMKKGVEMLGKEVSQDLVQNSDEMNEYKKKVKKVLTELINDNNLINAKKIIEEYENIIKEDLDICSMKAVIAIVENRLEDGESILKNGLEIDKNNFDLNYNLGYVYEQLEKFNLAIDYYSKAEKYCTNTNMKNEISDSINRIKDHHDNLIVENRKKIVFFSKGDDKFIWDIINELSKEYETKKVTVRNFKEIDEWMEWADICWFEWCDELVAYGSKHKLAKEKKIICRLHSYEAFTDYPKNVNWNDVNKIIFVAEHIRDFVVEKFKVDKNKTTVIANGVDIDKYTFKVRNIGFNIAYVGYINYKKGPMLLLHTFKAIYDRDNRYKLYIAGQFQDDRDVLYFKQMTKEFGIERNVFFEGWQSDLNIWLEDKNYILCTSILESQNMSVMQAMAKGIKPIIHNFVGARSIYKHEYIWSTINESTDMIIEKEYDSIKYRDFIEDKYSINKQIIRIKNMMEKLKN
ncbi:family 2 glycosyl transferase [Clostridium sartagoforme AAU1]|uniref:Family 2 glycosyl transferase n=1 Tax=Clostridium sartagoforme AAU1 TaxID=1202534 RepID=R9BSS7_9CLOT|nr:glycosyltransferase [Clostridium sartagoforme]EOR20123.1 family 2 glycosyl transferase [Clostridium sartagoforme AAU1]